MDQTYQPQESTVETPASAKKSIHTEKGSISCFQSFKEILLMVHDGLGFFGFDDTKIDRLRGKPVTWCTPFTSKKQNLILIIGLVVGIFIISTEVQKTGPQK